MPQLTKPQFIKVQQLIDARSGYNVYAKVVKTEEVKSNDGLSTFIRAVVADETGCANAFFKGDSAKLIKEGAVIAIRNGRLRFFKNHLSIEIDIFGRVTPQNLEIKENTKENISEKQIEKRKTERRPRDRDNEERPRRRRQDDERPRRQDDRPRRPREYDDKPRKPREFEDKPRRPREDDRERAPRRPREDEERAPRRPREDQDRAPRPRGDDRRGDDKRQFRRDDRGDNRNRQAKFEGDRRPRDFEGRERRPPIVWTKIAAIEPSDENLNITAKIVSAEKVGRKVRLVIGDETAIVRAFIFNNEDFEVGQTIVLFKGASNVVKQHIELQLMDRGRAEVARREIGEVNKNVDMSAKEWVEAQ